MYGLGDIMEFLCCIKYLEHVHTSAVALQELKFASACLLHKIRHRNILEKTLEDIRSINEGWHSGDDNAIILVGNEVAPIIVFPALPRTYHDIFERPVIVQTTKRGSRRTITCILDRTCVFDRIILITMPPQFKEIRDALSELYVVQEKLEKTYQNIMKKRN